MQRCITMIQPTRIKSNLSFGTSDENIARLSAIRAQNVQMASIPQNALENDTLEKETKTDKKPPKEKRGFFGTIKKGIVNIVKGFNNLTGVAGGFIKGIIPAVISGAIVGVLGKNLAENNNNFAQAIGNITKNLSENVIKSLSDFGKNIIHAPSKFFNEYLKGCTKTKVLVIAVPLAILAISATIGKMKANKKNSEVDHYTNEGHARY